MQYIEFKKLSEDKIKAMLNSSNDSDIIYAIFSLSKHMINYDLALQTIENCYFNNSSDNIKRICVEATMFIPPVYGRMNLILLAQILNNAFQSKNVELVYSAGDVTQDYLRMYPQHSKWFFDNIPYSVKYNKQDISSIIPTKLNRKFCCDNMKESVDSGIIEYEDIFRNYYMNSNNSIIELKECPWCFRDLGTSLNADYFDILIKEYGIEVPDLTNFSNIPLEFQTDEWWKKRGL